MDRNALQLPVCSSANNSRDLLKITAVGMACDLPGFDVIETLEEFVKIVNGILEAFKSLVALRQSA